MEYLAHFRDSGLEIGPDQHIEIPGGVPIVMNDRLVAVLFCDDMFLVSGSAEGLQQLLYKAGEVYDFAGARQVAYKSFAGCSIPPPPTSVVLPYGGMDKLRVRTIVRQWAQEHLLGGSDRQAASWVSRHIRHEETALTICRVDVKMLDVLGDPVTRDGVVAKF